MQIAIKGLTNDYAQYIRDKMSEGIKGKDLHAESLRQLSNAEVQEANAKFKSLPSNGTFERYDGVSLTIDGAHYKFPGTSLFSRYYNSIKHPEVSEMGKRNTIDTPFGEMRVALKINDNVSIYLDQLSQLASFDVNADGFVGKSDINAKNLVLVGYDEDGKEIEINLLEALGGIDITQFFEYKPNAFQSDYYSEVGSPIRFESEAARRAYHNASKYNMGIATEFRPEESHQQLKKENVIDFFKSYADKSGWIDFTNLDTFSRVFAEKGLDLSYRKTGADGSTRLERINFYTNIKEMRETEEKGERFLAWEYQAAKALRGGGDDFVFKSKNPFKNNYKISDSYNTLRENLNELVKTIESIDIGNGSYYSNYIANKFYQLTGMNFSESNFAILKEGLQNGGTEFLDKLSDFNGDFFNVVVGMQLDEESSKITMLFGTGKEVTIAIEDLYSGNGELTVDENGNRASVMNEAREMSEEELNDLDFSQVGAVLDERGTVVSLKELGITAIQKATYGDGRFLSFILTNADGVKFTTQDLFNMSFISSGGLDSRHQSDSNAESKSAFANVEDKNSNSTTSRMRKPHPIVFPTSPVDLHI
ncbi:MAG: hypothetical protein K2N12_04060 [Helicobacter sp.]|nr:hypothetical protein [Helicobacter sp.]